MSQQLQITPEMIKNSRGVSCDECGNITFTEKLTFIKISSILSPTGKDELVPMPVILCDKCGKVSKIFDSHGVVPKKLLATVPNKEPKMEIVKK